MSEAVTYRAGIELPMPPDAAFAVIADELAGGLERLGITLEPSAGSRVVQGGTIIGRVICWEPGRRAVLEWQAPDWQSDDTTRLELRLAAAGAGTSVVLEHRAWSPPFADPAGAAAWFAGEVLAPIVRAASPPALGDWFTDRNARRPFGAEARATYADPLYHYPNFRVLLEELALSADDHLLEVGCGGGALLKAALRSGCRAAAIDHSHDMVRVASEANRESIAEGRLRIEHGSADELPFQDATFTKAVMTGVLGFLPDPVRAFGEIRRVLRPGGLFVSLGSDPELKGTPAAPEPMASRLRFYDDRELTELGRAAGFDEVRVVQRDLAPFARDAGVPEEHLPLFDGSAARFLLARRTR